VGVRTENILEDVRGFLARVLEHENLFNVKIDCLQKAVGKPNPAISIS
jgi:hypothetical protein